MGTSASGRSIIDPTLLYYTYTCLTNEDLRVHVQPLSNGLTNIELVNVGEDCPGPVQQTTEILAADAFRIFDCYIRWMD